MNNLKQKKNTLQLPERVQDIIHKLKANDYDLEFKSDHDSIHVKVWKNKKHITMVYLLAKLDFDMFDHSYDELRTLLDPKIQRKIKAVEKYLNGIIEY